METSQTIGKISEALAKAQGQMRPSAFDAVNPHFRSKYATLTSIVEACRIALSSNNLAVIQGTSVDLDPVRVNVTTLITHSSGEFIKETLSLKPASDTPQAIGSCISYARRYGLSALIGAVSDEDDDANAANSPAAANNMNAANHTNTSTRTKLAVVKDTTQVAAKTNSTKVNDTQPAMAQNTTPANPSSAVTSIPSAAQAPSKEKLEIKPEPAKQQPQNTRVAKIRQIFQLSASLTHTPDQMKSEIGRILGLAHPIRESKEIPDNMLDVIIEQFTTELNNNRKEKAA